MSLVAGLASRYSYLREANVGAEEEEEEDERDQITIYMGWNARAVPYVAKREIERERERESRAHNVMGGKSRLKVGLSLYSLRYISLSLLSYICHVSCLSGSRAR